MQLNAAVLLETKGASHHFRDRFLDYLRWK